MLRVPDSILTYFVSEIFLTVAFILPNCCGVIVCRDSIDLKGSGSWCFMMAVLFFITMFLNEIIYISIADPSSMQDACHIST